jgi:hypothetical protein
MRGHHIAIQEGGDRPAGRKGIYRPKLETTAAALWEYLPNEGISRLARLVSH